MPYFRRGEKIAVFIDGANTHTANKTLGLNIDYQKLYDFFDSQADLVRIYYYTTLIDDQEYSPIRPLIDWLDYNGYTMVTKTTKESRTDDGKRKFNNMDLDMAMDIVDIARKIDHVVILTGNDDFRRVVEWVQREAVRVTVISTLQIVSDDLRRRCDRFIDLADLKDVLTRDEERAPHQDNHIPPRDRPRPTVKARNQAVTSPAPTRDNSHGTTGTLVRVASPAPAREEKQDPTAPQADPAVPPDDDDDLDDLFGDGSAAGDWGFGDQKAMAGQGL
jgi:uncharacterized LabA/DUF88 family protein